MWVDFAPGGPCSCLAGRRGRQAGIRDVAYRRARLLSRQRKARHVARFVRSYDISSVLFVGVGQGWEPLDLVVERAAAELVPLRVATDLHERTAVPWTYLRCDGLALPFGDQSFDLVMSNAVIEHVGDERAQRRFVLEHQRVGRHWLLTTPNRWFPVETHTRALFLHWRAAWRQGKEEAFTRLLSRRELARLLPAGACITGRPWSPTFVAASAPLRG